VAIAETRSRKGIRSKVPSDDYEHHYDHERAAYRALKSLHEGSWDRTENPLPVSHHFDGYTMLAPEMLGWSRTEAFAYLAGVMDSDGSFRIERRHVQEMLGPQYRIAIRCAQVKPSPAVELLAKTFGGRTAKIRSRWPNHRELVSWSLFDRSAVPAIKALLPFLRVKTREAYILLQLRHMKLRKQGLTEWQHRNRWGLQTGMRKRCFTQQQFREFEELRLAVNDLHSGRHPPKGSARDKDLSGPRLNGT